MKEKRKKQQKIGFKLITITIILTLVFVLSSDVFAMKRMNSRIVSMPVTGERTVLQVGSWEVEDLSDHVNSALNTLDYYIDQHIRNLMYSYPDMDLSIFTQHRENIAAIFNEYVDEFNRVVSLMRQRDFDFHVSNLIQTKLDNWNLDIDDLVDWIYFIDADNYYNLLDLQYEIIKRIYNETRLFFITHHERLHVQNYGCILYEYIETIEYIEPEQKEYADDLSFVTEEQSEEIKEEMEDEEENKEEVLAEKNVIVTSVCIEYGLVETFDHRFDFLFEIMDIIHDVRIFDHEEFLTGMNFFSTEEGERHEFDAVFDEVYRQLTYIESDPMLRQEMLLDIFFNANVNWRTDHINEFIPAYKDKRRSMLLNFHQVGAIGDNWWWFHRGHRSWIDQDDRRRTLILADLPSWNPDIFNEEWEWTNTILNENGTEFLSREEIMQILERSITGIYDLEDFFSDAMLSVGCAFMFLE